MKIPVCQLDRKLPKQTSNDLPRALTEFGQQAEVNPSRRLVLGLAKNRSALALLWLFGRRMLRSKSSVAPRWSGHKGPKQTVLMRGKLSALSVARLLLYADLLG